MKALSATVLAVLLLCVFAGCNGKGDPVENGGDTTAGSQPQTPPPDPTPVYTAEVVNTYPHDTSAFTQGLLFHDGFLYESTGLIGSSSLRKTEIETGKVLHRIDVGGDHFAEGLALLDGKLYQLTWRSGLCFIYDLKTFNRIDSFTYVGEGWGITTDGTQLYMSDGTNLIKVIDPKTGQVVRTVSVLAGGNPLGYLNELEWVNGEIFANVWTFDRIARIDPQTGGVKGWINLGGILPTAERTQQTDVLNGIAYDPKGDRLFVTGKKWPKLFEVRLRQQGGNPTASLR